jgi:hypothetical protein
MNLRWVHAVLIMLSAALAALFGVWSMDQYGVVTAMVAFAVSLGLVFYDSWFLRKTRRLR